MINEKMPHDTLETNRHIIKYKAVEKPKQKIINDIKEHVHTNGMDMNMLERMISDKFGFSQHDKTNHLSRKQNFSIHFLLKMLDILDLEIQFVKKKKQ